MVVVRLSLPMKSQASKFLPIYSLVFFLLLLKTNFLFVRLLINLECKRIKEIKEREKRKNPLFSSFWQRDFKENCVRRSEKKLTFMDPLAHPFLVSFLLILLCMLYWKLTEWFQIFHRHSKPKGTGSVPAAPLPWGGFPYVFLFLFPCFRRTEGNKNAYIVLLHCYAGLLKLYSLVSSRHVLLDNMTWHEHSCMWRKTAQKEVE